MRDWDEKFRREGGFGKRRLNLGLPWGPGRTLGPTPSGAEALAAARLVNPHASPCFTEEPGVGVAELGSLLFSVLSLLRAGSNCWSLGLGWSRPTRRPQMPPDAWAPSVPHGHGCDGGFRKAFAPPSCRKPRGPASLPANPRLTQLQLASLARPMRAVGFKLFSCPPGVGPRLPKGPVAGRLQWSQFADP